MLLWSTFFVRTEMLPVERVIADWERPAKLGPLYSLAPLYKTDKACPASTVTLDQTCLNKKGAAHHWLPSFWIGLVSINPLMRYIKPRITPPSPLILAAVLGAWVWQVILAGSGFPHVANPPNTLAKALAWVGGDVRDEVWFGSFIQRLIVLWWFLQTYLRSGSFYSWIFLRI